MGATWYERFKRDLGTSRTLSSSGVSASRTWSGSSTSGSRRTQYQPRGWPEAFRAEDFIPEQAKGEQGGAVGALDTLIRTPAYTAERPISAIDQLVYGDDMESSVLDPVAEGLRGIPFLGEHLDNAGKIAEDAFDTTFTAVGSVMNAPHAQLIDGTKDLDKDDAINGGLGLIDEFGAALQGVGGGIGAFLNPNDSITVGEYERFLQNNGWDRQDFADIRSGKKGWLDFGERAIVDPQVGQDDDGKGGLIDSETWQAVNDMGSRMVLDPLNLMFGMGIISKAQRGTQVVKAMQSGRISQKTGRYMLGVGGRDAEFAARLGRSEKLVTKHIYKAPPVPVSQQVARLAGGHVDGVTLAGMGRFGKQLITGYAKTAIGITTGQVAVNLVDGMVPKDWEVRDGIIGDALDFFDKMGQRKPLSKNDLFTLSVILKTPGRTIASSVWKNTGKAAAKKARRPAQVNALLDLIEPQLVKEKGYKAAWEHFVNRIGTEVQAEAAVYHVMRTALHEKDFLRGLSSLPRYFSAKSLAEIGYSQQRMNSMLTRVLRRAVEEGTLSQKDMQRGAELFVKGRGGVLEDVAGLTGQFNPEDFYRTWAEWEPLARRVAQTFDNGHAVTPGIASDVILDDDIGWALAELEQLAKRGPTAGGAEVIEVLRTIPAIHRVPEAQMFQKLLTADGLEGTVDIAKAQKTLKQIRERHAISRTEYFSPAEAREHLNMSWDEDARNVNRAMADGSDMPRDISPAAGKADVVFDYRATNTGKAVASGHEGRFLSNVEEMRAHPDVIRRMSAIPRGLRLAGIDVISAVDSAFLHRTRGVTVATPALLMRMNEMRSMVDMMQAAALALKNTAGRRATIVLRGDNVIASKNLVANAREYSYTVGRLNTTQWDDLADFLREFGDRVTVNTREGSVRILVPDGVRMPRSRLEQAEKLMGRAAEDPVHFRDIIKGKQKTNVGKSQYRLDDVINGNDELGIERLTASKRYHSADDFIRGQSGALKPRQSKAYRDRLASAAGVARPRGTGRPGDELTGYESRTGGGVRGRTEQHRVADASIQPGTELAGRWERELRRAGLPAERARLYPGDRLFATGPRTPSGSNAGVVVRANGEFVPWRTNAKRAAPADWDDTIAEAAEYASWTRLPEPNSLKDSQFINQLGEHGFYPTVVARDTQGELVYLLRDVGGDASVRYPSGKYLDAGQGHPDLIRARSPEQARAQIQALADNMYPEQQARMTQAAYDQRILRDGPINERQAARAEEIALGSVRDPGLVRFVKGAEEDASRFRTYLDDSVDGRLDLASDADKAKIAELEREMRRSGGYVTDDGRLVNATQYRLKTLPKGATPYFYGQNEALQNVMHGYQLATDELRTVALSKFGQMTEMVFGPVYAKELARNARTTLYNDLINAGATAREVDQFMAAATAVWNDSTNLLGARPWRAPDKLWPGKLEKLARGQMAAQAPQFKGFSPEVIEQIGSFSSLMQRSGSRTFQNLTKQARARDGEGNLKKLIDAWYGKGDDFKGVKAAGHITRRGTYLGGVAYTVLRFILDPRWYAMNALESDILGMARFGSRVRGINGGKARGGNIIEHMMGKAGRVADDPVTEAMAGRRGNTNLLSVEESLRVDSMASGWMDPRSLYGYVAEAMAAKRNMTDIKWLQKMADDGSPVIDDLKAQFGENQQRWMDEIDEFMFDVDSKGAKQAVTQHPEAKNLLETDNPAYHAFVDGLWKQHQDNFRDIVHVFHGNVNRSNLERLLNSPLLWWPISYQLKVGKWLIDVATKGMAGSMNELQGSAALLKVMENHANRYENVQSYRDMFDDHPALWQTMGMMLPMTPFDMGVFAARWSRYASSWTGAQLGLWDQDESYPQDPYNFAKRSLALGPLYSADIIEDIIREKDN